MSDDFVDISNTSPETLNTNEKDEKRSNKDETSHKDDETTISHKDETTDNFLEKENVFNSSDEIKENENIISLLLNGLLKNLMKNSASQKEEDDEEDDDDEENDEDDDDGEDDNGEDEDGDEDEDDGEEDEDDGEEDEDEEDYPEMFIIVENKKTFNYETSYADASRTMIARFHTFLEQNTSRYLRIDKNEEHITIYERHPNTFTPYEEHFIYHIEFFTVEKYKA
jgi:hypothetical protein